MIKAKVLCDSVNENGNRLTTFEIEVPRIVWAEFMTHRQFSRNAASSRAIPFDKMLDQLNGVPSRFGAAQKGMQDNGLEFDNDVLIECYGRVSDELYTPEEMVFTSLEAWDYAKVHAIKVSQAFKEAGYHKQIYNRLTEPFQMIKAIVSATEYSNFFWLRDDVMADPTIAELARKMKEAYDNSTPQLLKAGEWHLPYIHCDYFGFKEGEVSQHYYLSTDAHISDEISLEDAIKVSAARCAAVSYRNEDYGLEKCLQLYERLVGDERKHSSALEHQATPIQECVEWHGNGKGVMLNLPAYPMTWEDGVSHMDADKNLWSGNFKGWIQHRKTIHGECYKGEQNV
jgi:thymidylate synthase ThyX